MEHCDILYAPNVRNILHPAVFIRVLWINRTERRHTETSEIYCGLGSAHVMIRAEMCCSLLSVNCGTRKQVLWIRLARGGGGQNVI